MSLQITCPNCGRRAIEEFVHGEIPIVPDTIIGADERNLDRAFMHGNPEGPVTERWFHVYGCRRWLTLARDTRSDAMLDECTDRAIRIETNPCRNRPADIPGL